MGAIRRRKLVILLPALAVLAASFITIKRLPNVYQSSTFVIVELAAQGESATEPAHLDLQRRLINVREQATSRNRLEALIEKHNLYTDITGGGPPNERAITVMQGDIDVEVKSTRPDATESFRIAYQSRNPETARAVTAELVAQLISDNVTAVRDQVSSETSILGKRASDVADQLRQLEQKAPWLMSLREDSVSSPGGSRPRGSGQAVQRRLMVETLQDQQYKFQQQVADLERRISEQSQLVERQKKSQVARDNPTIGALIARRAELQGQRDNLINQQGLTEKHPRTSIIDDQISSINRTLAELNRQSQGAVSQSPEERELRSLESERNRIRVEMEVNGREVTRQAAVPLPQTGAGSAPQVPRDASAARLAQDYLGLKQSYKELTGKLQESELTLESVASSKIGQLRVLDEANLPETPIWPNRRLLGVVALVMAIVVGLGFGALAEVRRFGSVRTTRDVEFYTRLPLLGAIPRTLTAAERSAHRSRARLRLAATVAGSIVFTLLLSQVFSVLRVFEIIARR